MKLMGVDAARAAMLAQAPRMPSERVSLSDALDRTLAEPVIAERDQPPFDASAMDGWAVRAADGDGPRRIVGESAAGRPFAGAVGPGEAARIFTGAPIPAGADAVVIQEDARREGDTVIVPQGEQGRHVRPAGFDFRAGERLLAAGERMDPWRVALAAAAGRGSLDVAGRPEVAVFGGGDEIAPPGTAAGPHQIYDSGGPALAALVTLWGGTPVPGAPLADDLDAIANAAAQASGDLLVTIGGASVGDHDLVKPALARLGLTLAVESIAMRPGKPTWFGRLADGRRVLGLPGNPASALAGAELFLKPLILAALGADPETRLLPVRARVDFPENGGREHWMRVRLALDETGALWAEPFADQDSGRVAVFAPADALVRRRPGAAATGPGQALEALLLSRAGPPFR